MDRHPTKTKQHCTAPSSKREPPEYGRLDGRAIEGGGDPLDKSGLVWFLLVLDCVVDYNSQSSKECPLGQQRTDIRKVKMKAIQNHVGIIVSICTVVFVFGQADAMAVSPSDLKLQLVRTSENKNSFTGELFVNGHFIGHTLELPWKNNQKDVSSIPPDTYKAFVRYDKKDKWRIQLIGVPGRPGVAIHIGNTPDEITGCILIGHQVFNSKNKLEKSTQAYRGLRTAFYGSASPNKTPNFAITLEIKNYNEPTILENSEGSSWRYYGNGKWRSFPSKKTYKEYKRDRQYIYLKASQGSFFVRLPLFGGYMEYSSKRDSDWMRFRETSARYSRNHTIAPPLPFFQ